MQIIQAANPVVGVGRHYFYILKDDSGNIVGQLNGLQYKDGVPSTAGVGGKIMFDNTNSVFIDSNTIQKIVAIGPKDVILDKMWNAAIQCGIEINKYDYDYNMFDTLGGHNSNAVFSTLAQCMQLEIFKFDGLPFAPGLFDTLLNSETIKAIQAFNGLSTSNGTGSGGGEGSGGSSGGSGSSGGVDLPGYTPSPPKKGGGYWQNPESTSPTPAEERLSASTHNDLYTEDLNDIHLTAMIVGSTSAHFLL